MGGGVLKAAAGICEEVLQRLPMVNRDDRPGLSGLPVSVKSPSWAPGPGRTDKNRRISWADVVSGCIRSRARHSE